MSRDLVSRNEVVRVVAPLVILAVGIGGFVLLRERAEVPVRPPSAAPTPVVDTAPVAAHGSALNIDVDGQVVPHRELILSAEVAGRIVHKADVCRAGKVVRAGDTLLEIDPRDFDLEVQRLKEERTQAEVLLQELDVEVASTESLIQLAEELLKLQDAEHQRQRDLRADMATSAAALDQAVRNVLQAKNSRLSLNNQLSVKKTSRARLESAKRMLDVRLERARLDLARTKIEAPMDGMVVVENVEVNSYAQKGAPLVTIEDTSSVEVRCSLRMDELAWIWRQAGATTASQPGDAGQAEYQLPETPVTVLYQLGGQQFTWQGVLWRYDGIGLDEKTRTVPCRVLVRSPRHVCIVGGAKNERPTVGPPALVRGMYVTLTIHANPTVPLLQVPPTAIQPGGKVWRVRDERLLRVDVNVVEILENYAILRAADDQLQVGDQVVVSPLAEAANGMRVQARLSSTTPSPATESTALAREERGQ